MVMLVCAATADDQPASTATASAAAPRRVVMTKPSMCRSSRYFLLQPTSGHQVAGTVKPYSRGASNTCRLFPGQVAARQPDETRGLVGPLARIWGTRPGRMSRNKKAFSLSSRAPPCEPGAGKAWGAAHSCASVGKGTTNDHAQGQDAVHHRG